MSHNTPLKQVFKGLGNRFFPLSYGSGLCFNTVQRSLAEKEVGLLLSWRKAAEEPKDGFKWGSTRPSLIPRETWACRALLGQSVDRIWISSFKEVFVPCNYVHLSACPPTHPLFTVWLATHSETDRWPAHYSCPKQGFFLCWQQTHSKAKREYDMRPSNAAQWPGTDRSGGTVSYCQKLKMEWTTRLVPAYKNLVSVENMLIFKMSARNQAMRQKKAETRRPVLWLLLSPTASLLLTPWFSQQLCHSLFAKIPWVLHPRKIFQYIPPEGEWFLPRQFCLCDIQFSLASRPDCHILNVNENENPQ